MIRFLADARLRAVIVPNGVEHAAKPPFNTISLIQYKTARACAECHGRRVIGPRTRAWNGMTCASVS